MVYTPEQLFSDPEFADADCNSAPRFAVFGNPIAHSLSPVMQNAALQFAARSKPELAGAKYYAFQVAAEDLADVLPEFYKKNFAGINLTIPHKEVVLPLVKELGGFAKMAGACNTLKRTDGGWTGYNTDGFGLEGAVRQSFGFGFDGRDVVLLGAGGAARGAAFWALTRGCKSLTIANRSRERLEKLAADIRANNFECRTTELSPEIKIPQNAIVINATSIGLKDSDAPALDFAAFPESAVYFDMPYIRGRETNSVAAARKLGIRAASGLAMLAWQGAESLELWTGANRGETVKTMLEALGL